MKSICAICIRVGAKDLSFNSQQVSQTWKPISRLQFPAIYNYEYLVENEAFAKYKLLSKSLMASKLIFLVFVRQTRTARLTMSHREIQQHNDVHANLAQFNKRLSFVC